MTDRATADKELEELLAIAERPLPAGAAVVTPHGRSVQAFLDAHAIAPGPTASIETAALYQMYLAWATKVDAESNVLSPRKFAVDMASRGFKRKRPRGARRNGGRDRRVLLVRREAAEALIQWDEEHQTTDEQRTRFNNRSHDE